MARSCASGRDGRSGDVARGLPVEIEPRWSRLVPRLSRLRASPRDAGPAAGRGRRGVAGRRRESTSGRACRAAVAGGYRMPLSCPATGLFPWPPANSGVPRHDPVDWIGAWDGLMQIYLPIAEVSVNALLLLGHGRRGRLPVGHVRRRRRLPDDAAPDLLGIPPAVAVGTGRAQIVASSVSGALAQWRRADVDVQDGPRAAGGRHRRLGARRRARSTLLRRRRRRSISSSRSATCSSSASIGTLMLIESLTPSLRARRRGAVRPAAPAPAQLDARPAAEDALPRARSSTSARSRRSAIGCLVGVLAAIMGVGGGFIMVPAMIYLLGVPTNVVVGTSLFQIVFVTGGDDGAARHRQPDGRRRAGRCC